MGNNESTPSNSNLNEGEGNSERSQNQGGFDWEKALKIGAGIAVVAAGAAYLFAKLSASESAEKLFFQTVFKTIDTFGPTSNLHSDYEDEVERNQKACENNVGNEKIRRLDWTNIHELGISCSNRFRFSGYLEVLEKIPKFLKMCPNLTKLKLKDLLEKAESVLEHRRDDLKPGSASFSAHKRVICEWDVLKGNLEQMYRYF